MYVCFIVNCHLYRFFLHEETKMYIHYVIEHSIMLHSYTLVDKDN